MRVVNMHEAKSQLSKLVEEVLAGEEIIIAFGDYENEIYIPPDFDETDEEIIALFEGKK